MSWFQTGLSSLTGQIGNFTREVLTEGTEEIEDVATQLKMTRSRLNESELACSVQKKELDQLKKFTDELTVQMESKELQMQSIMKNFRETMADKEKELAILKHRELELLESSHSRRNDSLNESPGLADDTEDVLILQHKVLNLQSKVSDLEMELKEYKSGHILKHLSTDHQHSLHNFTSDEYNGNNDDDDGDKIQFSIAKKIASLENKIKLLEKQLSDQLDRHQHELVSLQDTHSRTLSSLKKNHANITEQMKDKILQLEKSLSEKSATTSEILDESLQQRQPSLDGNGNLSSVNPEVENLKERVDHLEKRNAKLEFDSAQVHAVDRKKSLLIEQLGTELETCKADVVAMIEKLKKEATAKDDLTKEFELLLEENQVLMNQLSDMKVAQKSDREELTRIQKELRDLKSADAASKDSGETREKDEEYLDDFQSKIIQLKKELMNVENLRITDSEDSREKIQSLELELKLSQEDKENLEKIIEEERAKVSDLLVEKGIDRQKLSDAELQLKEMAENYAESQKMRENIEAVLAMERRDRDAGAVVERDILKQKVAELERDHEDVSKRFESLKKQSDADLEETRSALAEAKERVEKLEDDKRKLRESIGNHEDEIEKLKGHLMVYTSSSSGEGSTKLLDDNDDNDDDRDEKKMKLLLEENSILKLRVQSLEQQINRTDPEDRTSAEDENAALVDELRREINDLKEALDQSESISRLYEAEIERLAKLEDELETARKENAELRSSSNKETEKERDRTESDDPIVSKRQSHAASPQKILEPADVERKKEVSDLKLTVSRQEELIKTLNGKYADVFRLLQDRSVELYGNDQVLARINQLQTEVDSMRKEREHMMSLLNDKTRESSSLKAEVHRLMDAVAATKSALVKMQNDQSAGSTGIGGSSLSSSTPGHGSPADESTGERDDMKKEAVKKLSQMIKDKDFEIDSLNKKNATLLQVLQTQSGESLNHEIKRLLMERDVLQKQVSTHLYEKDQLVNALDAKHSESLGYFEELAAQKKLVADLSNQLEKLQRSHKQLNRQLEEKQSNLIQLLDELSSCKRRTEKKRRNEKAMSHDDDAGDDCSSEKNGDKKDGDDDDDNTKDNNDDDDGGDELEDGCSKDDDTVQPKCSFIIGKSDDDDDPSATSEQKKSAIAQRRMNETKTSIGKIKHNNNNNDDNSKKASKKYDVAKNRRDASHDFCSTDDARVTSLTSMVVEKMMREKDQLIQEREEEARVLGNKLLGLESEVCKLQARLSSTEAAVLQKESEVAMSKKQVESLNFRLNDEAGQKSEVKRDFEEAQKRIESLTSELISVRQSSSSLSASLGQKEYEISSLLRELEAAKHRSTTHPDAPASPPPSVSTTTSVGPPSQTLSTTESREDATAAPGNDDIEVTAASGDDSSGEVVATEKLRQEYKLREDELLRGMYMMQHEREQLYLAVHYHQKESAELKDLVSKLQDREQRLLKKCERLREHLVSIEEGYTREALEAEEREKNLRNQLVAAQDKIASLSDSVYSNRSDLSKQTESLQLQLHAIAEQRDAAILQLSSSQETISSYSNSLSNLQMVLEQFQSEKSSHQSLEVERFQVAFNRKQLECQQLQQKVQLLLEQLEEHSEAIQAAQRLSEQMDKKEHLISALREEVRLRECELKKTEDEIKKLSINTEAKVDKILMKSLLIGYFHAPVSKRLEAFNVIGHILNFSNEELKNIGMSGSGSGGWIEGIFGKKPLPSSSSSSSPSSTLALKSQQSAFNQSFSELFVSFLERESTPNKTTDNSKLRLPVDKMVVERQQRMQQHQQLHAQPKPSRPSPSFNPFSDLPPSNRFSTPVNVPSSSSSILDPSKGVVNSALFERSSHLFTPEITAAGGFYPTVVNPEFVNGGRDRSALRDSFVPIVLAAALPSAELGYNNNSNLSNSNKK